MHGVLHLNPNSSKPVCQGRGITAVWRTLRSNYEAHLFILTLDDFVTTKLTIEKVVSIFRLTRDWSGGETKQALSYKRGSMILPCGTRNKKRTRRTCSNLMALKN